MVPFNLFGTLRVQSVTSNGAPLAFIQEDKREDSQFFVILPAPLARGSEFTVTTSYAGKEAISNEGGGNYFPNPGARDSWYPNVGVFTDTADFEMTFRTPQKSKNQIVAVGSEVSNKVEGEQRIA